MWGQYRHGWEVAQMRTKTGFAITAKCHNCGETTDIEIYGDYVECCSGLVIECGKCGNKVSTIESLQPGEVPA
jgi:hypothetical protein